MIQHRDIETARLRMHVREAGAGETAVMLLHGNCSSGVFFEELMAALAPEYRVIVPDLRGYGQTEPLPIDATRGVGDWADDVAALADALGLERFHLAGWSLGGGIAMRYALEHAARLQSLTLLAPLSPYGFGGTHGPDGKPNAPDHAGSGGGTVNADFARLIGEGDRSDSNEASPRNVMNAFYFKPPFRGTPEQEERWLDGLLSTRTGDDHYPGDSTPSPNWPFVAPGARGIANAMSGKYHNIGAAFAALQPQPPVLWVRGDADQIVSDRSALDLAYLGQLGVVPGWPGADACPPQPMVTQTRAVLDTYRANGGRYEEVVLADTGHSPHIEKPDEFLRVFRDWLAGA